MEKQDTSNRTGISLRKIAITGVAFIVVTAVLAFGIDRKNDAGEYVKIPNEQKDKEASLKAFDKVYSVLMSPRCLNCHPKGDVPLQGEDSHLHQMAPKRGKDGTGIYAMKCANCHQPENTPGLHAPPGNPKWHLPPADMKMVFEGKSKHDLAKQIMDFNQNGHKDMKKLIEHVDDTLVKAGWYPAEGLKKPPLSHKEFKAAWLAWLENGAQIPKK